jgi:hypothetical protein
VKKNSPTVVITSPGWLEPGFWRELGRDIKLFSPCQTLADFHSCIRCVLRRADGARGLHFGVTALTGSFFERGSCWRARDDTVYIRPFRLVLVHGAFFSSIVQPELRIESGFFRVALIYPPCYFVFFIATFQSSSPGLLGLILPLHVFAMVCMFYLLYFVSKSLVLAETSKPASFYDYAGPFFSSGFSPLVSGLSSQGSIDFTRRERPPNHELRRLLASEQSLRIGVGNQLNVAQILVNALTGQLKLAKNHLSDNATYRAVEPNPDQFPFRPKRLRIPNLRKHCLLSRPAVYYQPLERKTEIPIEVLGASLQRTRS